jgi:deoxyguanosine kinase
MKFIAIEGNIGSGKTTLATALARHFDARLILEEFADNNFLPKFYQDPERYAFPLELSFLADRFKQLQQWLLTGNLFSDITVSDYILTKSKLFARVNLENAEYELFQRLFDIINPNLPQPDVLLFLDAPIARLQENIRKRGRTYEQSISNEYLEKIDGIYKQFIRLDTLRTIVLDTTQMDEDQLLREALTVLEER